MEDVALTECQGSVILGSSNGLSAASGQRVTLISQDRRAETDTQTLPWFGVRVRSNRELVAALHLRERGYEEFSPSYKVERQWSDRKKIQERFLFPGYVFCRLNPQNRLPVLTAPGVVGLVSFGKEPCPIPEDEIENVRALLRSGLLVTPWPFLERGQRVLIERGPLAGLEGNLEEIKGKFRLVVSIQLLQRSVSAEIDRDWVRPVKSPQKRTDSVRNDDMSKRLS